MDKRPFEGLTAIDMCWSGVGASVMNMLSHYGATVIRAESARQPDPIRRVLTFTGHTKDEPHAMERSAYFAFTHPAKKLGMTLNLKNENARGVLEKLIARCDIFGESFPTGVIERLGFGYEKLKQIKPDIVMFRTCGYGHTGPLAGKAGFGMILSAASMMYSIAGWPDRPPVPVSSYYTDQLSPLCGMLAVAAALDYRRRTGKGQCVDQSQVESALNYLAPVLLDHDVNGRDLALTGNRSACAAPHGVYRCRGDERWVAISVSTDEEWRSFCRVIGGLSWAADPWFATTADRLKHGDELDKLVEAWTVEHEAEEVMKLLQAAGVGAGVVSNARDLVEDPQLAHYHFFREVDHPYLGKQSYYHPTAVNLSEAETEVGSPPLLGEHNQYICCELLGLSEADFTRLTQEGAFD